MRKNKILATAIASALSLGTFGVANVYGAETLEIRLLGPLVLTDLGATPDYYKDYDNGITGAGSAGADGTNRLPVTFASELFPANPDVPDPASLFKVMVKLSGIASEDADIYDTMTVKFTLTGVEGATWGSTLVATDATYCSTGLYGVGNCDPTGTSHASMSVSKGDLTSTDGESSADFVIQKTTQNFAAESNFLLFQFQVDDLTPLQNGGTLSLSAEGALKGGTKLSTPLTPSSVVLANAASAMTIKVRANDDPQRIAVDVAKDNKELIKGGVNTKTFELGNVLIESQGSKVKDETVDSFDLTNYDPFTIGLTVIGGAFAASKGEKAVYLEMDAACSDSKHPYAATVLKDDSATWKFTEEDTPGCFSGVTTANPVIAHIKMDVDGTTEINPLPSNPLGTFELIFTGKTSGIKKVGKLRPLKDNGTKCVVYNVPDGESGLGSIDVTSIRITNKTATPGFINGELFDVAGTSLFGGTSKKLADIGAYQTIRFNVGEDGSEFDLKTYVVGSKTDWAGERARLVIRSNVQDLEVLATVRNINGGAQMNMSTGATGSGCD